MTTPAAPVSRIGLIGDIHAEDELLESALAHLHRAGPDLILAVGDIVDGLGGVNSCCRLLREQGVLTVRGNHDRWVLANQMRRLPAATRLDELSAESRRFLAELPVTRVIATVAGPALLAHGLGENDMVRVEPEDLGYALEANLELQALIREGRVSFVLNGHTHRRMVRRFGALTIINAGTLKRDEDPCFALVDFGRREARFFEPEGGEVFSAETLTWDMTRWP